MPHSDIYVFMICSSIVHTVLNIVLFFSPMSRMTESLALKVSIFPSAPSSSCLMVLFWPCSSLPEPANHCVDADHEFLAGFFKYYFYFSGLYDTCFWLAVHKHNTRIVTLPKFNITFYLEGLQGLLRCFCLHICWVVASPVGGRRRRRGGKKWGWGGIGMCPLFPFIFHVEMKIGKQGNKFLFYFCTHLTVMGN